MSEEKQAAAEQEETPRPRDLDATITVPCTGHTFEWVVLRQDVGEMRKRGWQTIRGVCCPTCQKLHDLAGSAVAVGIEAALAAAAPDATGVAVTLQQSDRAASTLVEGTYEGGPAPAVKTPSGT